jgi:hypothetical protein
MNKTVCRVLAWVGAMLFAACVDGDSSNTVPPPDGGLPPTGNSTDDPHAPPTFPPLDGFASIVPAPAAGIWIGEPDAWFGYSRVLLINDRNEFRMIEIPSGIQGVGTMLYDNDLQLAAEFFALPPSAAHFDGWNSSCRFYGAILEEESGSTSIDADFDCEFSGSASSYLGRTGTYGSEWLERAPESDSDIDLGQFEGTWTAIDSPGRDVVSIDSSGSISGQHSDSGCVYEGGITDLTPDASRVRDGLFDVQWTYRSCSGAQAPLNDVPFSGMVYLSGQAGNKSMTIVASGAMPDGEASLILTYVVL